MTVQRPEASEGGAPARMTIGTGCCWHPSVRADMKCHRYLVRNGEAPSRRHRGSVCLRSVVGAGVRRGAGEHGGSGDGRRFQPGRRRRCRERAAAAGAGVDFRVADARDTGLPTGAFDLVVSCECLEHVPGPQPWPRSCSACVDRAGVVFSPRRAISTACSSPGSEAGFSRSRTTPGGRPAHENFFLFFRVRRCSNAQLRGSGRESRLFQWLLLPRTDPAD